VGLDKLEMSSGLDPLFPLETVIRFTSPSVSKIRG